MSAAGLLLASVLVAAPADAPATTIDTDSAAAPEAADEVLAVAVLPLQAGRTVTTKQAAGVLARLRAALELLANEDAIKLLPTTKDDDKVVRRCGQDAACHTDVATARGADVLVFGVVEAGDGGLRLVARTTGRAATEKALLFTADDDATGAALDRLARELVAPATLRGTLTLTGEAGDIVVVDGQRRGTIGDDGTFTLERLREGSHPVEVRRPDGRNGALYEPFTRDVAITHRETTTAKVVLLPKSQTATLGEAPAAEGPPVVAIAAVATGGALVLGGVGVGVFSLLDAFAVEDRAKQQQLVFPRDEALVSRGRTLAVVANVLYGAGAVVAGAGAAWWLLASPADDASSATSSTTATTTAATAATGGGR
jgi:hypothetical protein